MFNVGGDEPISHSDLTRLLIEVAGTGRVEYVEWPAEKKAIDIGSFYADSSRFRSTTGWTPTVGLREGLARTVAFYREHWPHYVAPSADSEQAPSTGSGQAHSTGSAPAHSTSSGPGTATTSRRA